MLFKFQFRRGTAAEWITANPILAAAEPGYETNTKKFKMGDGITPWTGLSYYLNQDAISAYVQEAVEDASPLSPEDIDQVSDHVMSELELPDLVLLWQNAKA